MSGYAFNLVPRKVPRVSTKHRCIQTKLPVPESLSVFEEIRKYESSNVVEQLPVVWDRAKGYQVFDRWGNVWIDFTSTIFVANAGHGHPHIVETIKTEADKLLHSYCYPTEIRARYLKKLIEFTPPYLEKASLFSTGTEASERAIKLARLYGQKFQPRRDLIVGGEGNFHGKTMGAQMAGGIEEMKEWIGYRDPNMAQIPFPYPWVLEQTGMGGKDLFYAHLELLKARGHDIHRIAAFIVESCQGWGALFYPPDYIQEMRRFSAANQSLLIFDEIQAGFGRTGKLFAYEHYDVEPDLVICGKAISSSLPLSAVLGRAYLIDLDPAYTSTHGGHPLACAAGLANIEVFEREGLIGEAQRKEAIFRTEFARWKQRFPKRIGRILGKGMLFGLFIMKPGSDDLDIAFTDRVIEKALYKGVFSIRTGRGTLKLGPPLNIPDEALIEGLRVYEEAIAEAEAQV